MTDLIVWYTKILHSYEYTNLDHENCLCPEKYPPDTDREKPLLQFYLAESDKPLLSEAIKIRSTKMSIAMHA